MKPEYKPLDKDLARRSHANVSFDPEKRGEQMIAYHKSNFDNLSEKLGDFFEQKHADKLHELWTDYLHAKSRCLSSMITGPARFPVARAEKATISADNKYNAIYEYGEKLLKWKRKADKREKIKAAGGEFEMKKTELEKLKKRHEVMKAGNKIIKAALKSGGITDGTINKLVEAGISSLEAADITTPNCYGGYGFETFQLTNSRAKIKSREATLAQMERAEQAKESGAKPEHITIRGGIISIDRALNRINVKHDEKPDRETITTIKEHGFRWSRNYSTWTRKLTNNAIYSTGLLAKKLA